MSEINQKPSQTNDGSETPRFCGIVRPIADFDPYPVGHWNEVHEILADAISSAGYEPRLVSESISTNIIVGNIVTNLYSDPVVVVDVSGRNSNVMFELGMRIAFEKPTVIVTDRRTPFSFDISPIKHLIYPESLRFADILQFKEELSRTIVSTAQSVNGGYLQQFGPIKATELAGQTVSVNEVAEDIRDLRHSIRAIEKWVSARPQDLPVHRNALLHFAPVSRGFRVDCFDHEKQIEAQALIAKIPGVLESVFVDDYKVNVKMSHDAPHDRISTDVSRILQTV